MHAHLEDCTDNFQKSDDPKGQMMNKLCDDQRMTKLLESIRDDNSTDVEKIDGLLSLFSEDPRLHFLKGSALVGKKRIIEAHLSLERAVNLAPDFAIARYQLGFLELTSGETDNALATWGPLLKLPNGHYLRRFVEGLTHLIRDEFEEAIGEFEAGIAINAENEPLNRDISLLITECRKMRDARSSATHAIDESATSFLLGQIVTGNTQH